MTKIIKNQSISLMITKIESTRGAMAPTSLMKYKLLNQMSMIKKASTILMNDLEMSGCSTFKKTTMLQMMIKKSVMLHILYSASFPRVLVCMKNTKQLTMLSKKERMLNTLAREAA